MGNVKVDKSDIFISYHVNGQPQLEYIPPEFGKLEKIFYEQKLRFLDRINAPTYYWQYRHFLGPTLRKIEDLKFLIHVYETHDFAPTDRVEKRHFKKAWNLYYQEFNTLIRPKIDQEKVGHGIIHQYALAYYKRWLRPINPNLTRMYHGVDKYEMLEMYDEILKNMKKDIVSTSYRMHYYDARARLIQKSKPAVPKKTQEKTIEELEAVKKDYNDFKKTYWPVDFLLSWLSFSVYFQSGGVSRPFWDEFFMFIGFVVVMQLLFVPIFYFIKFTRYQAIK